jgi:hypothetical protein
VAARHVQLREVFGAYYAAPQRVADVLRDLAPNKLTTVRHAQAGATLWAIRAAVVRTGELVPANAEEPEAFKCGSVHLKLVCSPFRAYEHARAALMACRDVTANARARLPHHVFGKVSAVFAAVGPELVNTRRTYTSRLMRYLMDPGRLAVDIEKTMREVSADLAGTASEAMSEGLDVEGARAELPIMLSSELLERLTRPKPTQDPDKVGYWDALAQLDSEAAMVDDMVQALADDDAAAVMDKEWVDGAELLAWAVAREAGGMQARDEAADVTL